MPAWLLLAAGALVIGAAWLLGLKRHRRALITAWAAVALVTVAFAGYRTWGMARDFAHPEIRMFRAFVADPIPAEVTGLAVSTAAPAMYHDGALVRFQAPEAMVRGLVNHSVPGSRTLSVAQETRGTSARDRADRDRVVGPDGWSYAQVDAARFAVDGPEVFEWARRKVGEGVRQGPREVWVYLVSGDWGRFQSVLVYDRATSTATVEQYRERRR